MNFQLVYRRFSEHSILVEWPSEIDKKILDDVLVFKEHLLNLNIKSIVEINNSYSSILIIYNCTIDKIYGEILTLKAEYFNRGMRHKTILRHWKIPVCYDEEFALDLHTISVQIGMSKSDVIKLHSETNYTVFFIGFLPGFLYLGGVDKRLYIPRMKSPRSRILKGAIGIGGYQTGIYPNASPGGWNIIGNSPLSFFDPNQSKPCFASSGDIITFVQVDMKQYEVIKRQVANGTYQIESEVIDG